MVTQEGSGVKSHLCYKIRAQDKKADGCASLRKLWGWIAGEKDKFKNNQKVIFKFITYKQKDSEILWKNKVDGRKKALYTWDKMYETMTVNPLLYTDFRDEDTATRTSMMWEEAFRMNEKKRSIIFIAVSVLLLLGSVIAASLCRWLLLFTLLPPIFWSLVDVYYYDDPYHPTERGAKIVLSISIIGLLIYAIVTKGIQSYWRKKRRRLPAALGLFGEKWQHRTI